MKKVAIAIPTFEGIIGIEKILGEEYRFWKESNADIYIYDSSNSNNIREYLLKNWNELNIIYRQVNSEIQSNLKVMLIYKELSEKKLYDYIWMRRDGSYYEDETLRVILGKINGEYDFIVLDDYEKKNVESVEYNDAISFGKLFTYQMILYGGTVINVNRILEGINWHDIIFKYCYEDCIYFSHVGLYLEQFTKLSSFSGLYLSIGRGNRKLIDARKKSFWSNDIIKVWGKGLILLLNKLPSEYQDEEFRKKTILNANAKRFNRNRMLTYRLRNIYNVDLFERYKLWLVQSTNLNENELFEIASMSELDVAQFFKNYYENFTSKHKVVALYGTGQLGKKCAEYLDDNGIRYDFFVVSEGDCSKNINGHKIKLYSEVKDIIEIGFIICLNKENSREVIPTLESDGFVGNYIESII